MIRINCTKCKAVLEVDEGFAGGSCRCQHCGTIQTVPKYLKRTPAKAPAIAGATSQRQMESQGTGLDDLAGAVASSSSLGSSGLSSSALRQKPAAVSLPPVRARRAWPALLLGMLLGGGIGSSITWYVMHEQAAQQTNPPQPTQQTATPEHKKPIIEEPVVKGPAFMGIAIEDAGKDKPPVLYVLDCDDGAKPIIDGMRLALLRSLESLGTDSKFQVIYWSGVGKLEKYPTTGPINVAPDKIKGCQEALEASAPKGKTDLSAGLKAALEKAPGVILFASNRPSISYAVMDGVVIALKKKNVRIDTFAINGSSDVLKSIAEKSGGTYNEVGETQLAKYAK